MKLTKLIITAIPVIITFALFISCENSETGTGDTADSIKTVEAVPEKGVTIMSGVDIVSDNAAILADTVIYDVIIKNPNPADEWQEECLRKIDRAGLIETIFNAIYEEKLTAYDYINDTPFTLEEVKDLESAEDYDRDKIGKVQFSEEWYFDKEKFKMFKRVRSIILGYESLDENNEVKYYTALFKVYLDK